MMTQALFWTLLSRQTFSRKRGLSVFLSRLSVAGLVVGIAILIAVLSVMNGFEQELQTRILGLAPHVTIKGEGSENDWREVREVVASVPGVTAVIPFEEHNVLIVRGNRVVAGKWLGLDGADQQAYAPFLSPASTALTDKTVAMGAALMARMGLQVGDDITVIIASERRAQADPRPEQWRVAAALTTGTELDEVLLLGGRKASGDGGSGLAGLALKLDDVFAAGAVSRVIARQLPPAFYAFEWQMVHGNLYAAIKLSRSMVAVLLLSIIGVAAFNVISSLILVSMDQRPSIAILRTQGVTKRQIAYLFLLQGALIGGVGTVLGVGLGVGLAWLAPSALTVLEGLLGYQMLNTDVYPLSFLPIDIRAGDIAVIALTAITLCVLAAVVPAIKAAHTDITAHLGER
jgi:lipoprotein-releasing system permease protein